jgi:RNA polymerase sigma-32 factor
MKAVKRFDPDRGVRLVSFAMHWIKAEIHEYILKNWRLVKIATTKAQRKLFFNLRSIKAALAQDADSRQGFNTLGAEEVIAVAKQLGVKPEEVVEMETRLTGADVSLEPLNDDDEDSYAPIAYLAADRSIEPASILERKEYDRLQDEGLSTALASLDDRSRAIVQRRWLVADGEEAATLHELAAEYGVSAERIRQIEVKAMQKMKTKLLAA